MKCVICRHGETEKGETVITLLRNDSVIVVKNVPADICNNCGEKYVSEEVTREVLTLANSALQKGVVIDVRDYKAA